MLPDLSGIEQNFILFFHPLYMPRLYGYAAGVDKCLCQPLFAEKYAE